ncbi:MAG: COX15/CtaA family protein [Acidobacteria bacterium]|nr:COX15/CtaA family protein [Acidobacteriota bacterium]
METARTGYNRWLHAYATLVAFATLVLIIAGALVTGNDAGLSVPDWPTSFGTFRMPRMVGGVLYEHGHRMIAATVGFLTVVLAVGLWLCEPRRWVRRLGLVAVLAVIAQGVLGGITVLFYLPTAVSVGHASLAQGFFCIMVSLALFTGRNWRWDDAKTEDSGSPSLRHLTVATSAAIFLQLMLGAAFRHNGVGIIPHIVGAAAVTVGAIWALARVFTRHSQERRLTRPAIVLGSLLVVQLILGVASYWMRLEAQTAPQPLPRLVGVTTAHVAIGALVLAVSVVLTLYVFRLAAAPGRAPEISSAPQKAAA